MLGTSQDDGKPNSQGPLNISVALSTQMALNMSGNFDEEAKSPLEGSYRANVTHGIVQTSKASIARAIGLGDSESPDNQSHTDKFNSTLDDASEAPAKLKKLEIFADGEDESDDAVPDEDDNLADNQELHGSASAPAIPFEEEEGEAEVPSFAHQRVEEPVPEELPAT